MLKLRLVSDIPAHLKRYTVRGLAALVALQPVWLAIDSSIKGGMPMWLTLSINSAIALAVLASAFFQQPDIKKEVFFDAPEGGVE